MKPKSPSYIELQSVQDLGRLVCALERSPLPVFSMKYQGKNILATHIDVLVGKPLIYYANVDATGEFLAYSNMGGFENVSLVNSFSNPTLIYAPVIKVEQFPVDLRKNAKVGRTSSSLSIKLKDLTSLAKISSYKMIYEEPPLPLFLFRHGKWILGSFMDADNGNGLAFFYYVVVDSIPLQPFLKYSANKAEKTSFTANIDEHGYIYMKVIKLCKDHPLVTVNGK